MKKIAFIAFILIGALTFGQEIDVPNAVNQAFNKKYSGVNDVTWKLKKTNYQATFVDVETTKALFTPEGKWIKTSMVISEDELPVLAIDYVNNTYEDANITKVKMVENHKEETKYHISMLVGEEKVKLKFDDEGELIKQ